MNIFFFVSSWNELVIKAQTKSNKRQTQTELSSHPWLFAEFVQRVDEWRHAAWARPVERLLPHRDRHQVLEQLDRVWHRIQRAAAVRRVSFYCHLQRAAVWNLRRMLDKSVQLRGKPQVSFKFLNYFKRKKFQFFFFIKRFTNTLFKYTQKILALRNLLGTYVQNKDTVNILLISLRIILPISQFKI